MAQKLGENGSSPWSSKNRAGAGGNIGTEAAARAPRPDGYTLVLGTVGTHAINQSLYRNLPYDATRDFTAITMVANTPNVLVLNPGVRTRSVQELIALAGQAGRPSNYARPATARRRTWPRKSSRAWRASPSRMCPYKGSAPAMTDLLGGQVQMMIANAPVVLPYIKSGKLIGLASTSATRPAMLRDIPTFAESGLKGYEADTWYGLFKPAGTPPAVIEKLNADVVAVLKSPDIQAFFAEQGAEVIGDSAADANAKVRAEVDKWHAVIQSIGLKMGLRGGTMSLESADTLSAVELGRFIAGSRYEGTARGGRRCREAARAGRAGGRLQRRAGGQPRRPAAPAAGAGRLRHLGHAGAAAAARRGHHQ